MKNITIIALCFFMLICFAGCKANDYKTAAALFDSGDYSAAAAAFAELGDYKDSAALAAAAQEEADYETAAALFDSGEYAAAVNAFTELGNYKDSADRAAEAQAAEDKRIFIEEATEKLSEIEELASAQMSEYKDFRAEIDAIEGEKDYDLFNAYEWNYSMGLIDSEFTYKGKEEEFYNSDEYYITAGVTDYYTQKRLRSYPNWDETYAMYLRLIETDSEESDALVWRFKNALGEIEELRFYLTKNLYRDLDQLEKIVSNIETIGFSQKAEELNKELLQLRYWDFYTMSKNDSKLEEASEEISMFPDSEVKTLAEYAYNLRQEVKNEEYSDREKVNRALGLVDELNALADTLHNIEQPGYFLKNYLIALANSFKYVDYNYYWECNPTENITPELEAYYNKTSAGKSPIDITWDGFYIVPYQYNDAYEDFDINSIRNDLMTNDTKLYMHYASKPDEVRYIINFSATTSYYGSYSYTTTTKVTKAYSVNVTLYLKDCKTGKILYTDNFKANPPSQITVGSIPETYYPNVTWSDSDIEKLVSALKSALGIK
jgi:hypothetical protein